jgi:hypothetical protein
MTGIILAQLLVIGIIKLWPAQPVPDGPFSDRNLQENAITFEEAIITRQTSSPPPPPQPTAPIPEPTDEIIEEELTELDDIQYSENPDPLSESQIGEQGEEEGPVAGNPQQPPRVTRIVEATATESARRANVKAEITVQFLVDRNGNVEEATIQEIRLYEGGGSGDFKIVDSIGYGLEEETLESALQWKFQPARENGNPVRAYSEQVFTFGF